MFTPKILFFVFLLSSFLAIAVIVWQLFKLRLKGQSIVVRESIISSIESAVDVFAFYIVLCTKDLLRYIYLAVILGTQKVLTFVRFTAGRLEKYFASVATKVKGKDEMSNKGSASLFLQQIKYHQDNWRNNIS